MIVTEPCYLCISILVLNLRWEWANQIIAVAFRTNAVRRFRGLQATIAASSWMSMWQCFHHHSITEAKTHAKLKAA